MRNKLKSYLQISSIDIRAFSDPPPLSPINHHSSSSNFNPRHQNPSNLLRQTIRNNPANYPTTNNPDRHHSTTLNQVYANHPSGEPPFASFHFHPFIATTTRGEVRAPESERGEKEKRRATWI
ncbi:hypothetical protein Droror1_Dr00023253 [Drosera rotundifolia]